MPRNWREDTNPCAVCRRMPCSFVRPLTGQVYCADCVEDNPAAHHEALVELPATALPEWVPSPDPGFMYMSCKHGAHEEMGAAVQCYKRMEIEGYVPPGNVPVGILMFDQPPVLAGVTPLQSMGFDLPTSAQVVATRYNNTIAQRFHPDYREQVRTAKILHRMIALCAEKRAREHAGP